ncbi:hypothetical protein B0O99DRAFT_296117 [Bisporella sp. PMI_857]|nr:hypothetical protein B0O99DRAFT_296117 [Bisporella sp. PMI_857]
MYYEQESSRHAAHSSLGRELNAPLVLGGSPSHGLKDMLVPSIETSSDAFRDRRAYSGREQEPYRPGQAERRMLSPPPRRVIVIDDSPEAKPPRCVHENASQSGRQSQLPVSSSVHPIDFLSHSGQRIPIYDATPADDIYFTQKSQTSAYGYERSEPERRKIENPRLVALQDNHPNKHRNLSEPRHPPPLAPHNRVPLHGHASPQPRNGANQAFIDNFSHIRVENSQPSFISQDRVAPHYEDHTNRSFLPYNHASERSPARFHEGSG